MTTPVQDTPASGLVRPAGGRVSKRSVGAVIGVVAAAAIALGPDIATLDRPGQSGLAIIALAVVFWAFDVLNAGITAVLVLALLIISGVPSSVALSGYATGAFWILVSVLFFGTAMEKTGLARRISYRILLAFRPTYGGVLFAFMVIGFVLTFGIPSMTVRTAVMVPIAVALVRAVQLPLPSPGAAVIVLSAFEMAVLPGCALLTGALWGPFVAGLFTSAGFAVTWLEWARVLALPTVLWCGALLVANVLVLRPPAAAIMDKAVIRDEVRRLGPMGRVELVTAAIVALSVAAWATQPWHRVPAEAVGMVALAALFAAGVLQPPDIGTGIPWALAIFVGGMLSLTTVMTTYKINAWVGGYILPTVQPFFDSPFALVGVLALTVAAMRFIDPLGFITLAATILPLAAVAASRGVPPLVLAGIILLPLHVFWFNYQNMWLVMTEGISKKAAYTDADRFKLATAFFVVTLLMLGVSVVYWRLIGVM